MDQNDSGTYRHYIVLTEDILGTKELTVNDKILLAYISGFDEFWASNASAAEFLGISERSIERSKQKLARLGYISTIRDTGRGRVYALNLDRFAKNGGPGSPNLADQTSQKWRTYNINYIKENNIIGANAPADKEKETEAFGRDDINELADLWESETGIAIKKDKNERRQLYNLIRKHGRERMIALVKALGDIKRNGDRFAPQIATPRELTGKYSKLPRLELWLERKNASRQFGDNSKTIPAPSNAMPSREIPRYGGAFDEISETEREAVSAAFKEARKKLPFMQKGGSDD